jgi:NADH:ubiquinone oxidoreductase subunit F (NADH-binding)
MNMMDSPDTISAGTSTRGATRLLLRSVRLARTGNAEPIDRVEGHSRDSLADHANRFGARPLGGQWLVDALADAQLSGRGGGHYPAASKWRAAMAADGQVWLVANAAESEPLSGKDATLLRQSPHLVLDGLALAAETVGATRALVWLHDHDVATRLVLGDAIAERRAAGIVEPLMVVVAGPSTYLAGESSAIARWLVEGEALPTFRGFDRLPGRPPRQRVLVHNVETLARVALVARGVTGMPSTLLTVVTPNGRHVLETSASTRLADALTVAGWPASRTPQAVLLGGFGGSWARWRAVEDVAVNESAMRAAGVSLGAGIVAAVPGEACGVAETAAVMAYLEASSARQCGPCLFGLDSLAQSLEKLRIGRARRSELGRVAADLEAVRGRGSCHHPDGAARLVASALDTFDDDFARHARGRPCAFADAHVLPVPGVA